MDLVPRLGSAAGIKRSRDVVLFLAAALAGLLIWLGIAAAGGRKEAWDSEYFSTLGLPVMALVSGLAGYLRPGRPWVWGIATVILQPIALYRGGDLGPFGPLGLVFFGIFAVALTVCAMLGSFLRRHVAAAGRRPPWNGI